jgi:hypothetical protein
LASSISVFSTSTPFRLLNKYQAQNRRDGIAPADTCYPTVHQD